MPTPSAISGVTSIRAPFACRRFDGRQHRGRRFARPAGSLSVAGRIARLASPIPRSVRARISRAAYPQEDRAGEDLPFGRAAVSPFATISADGDTSSDRSAANRRRRGPCFAASSLLTGPRIYARRAAAALEATRPADADLEALFPASRTRLVAVRQGAGARRGVPTASADCQPCVGEQDRRRTRHRHHRDHGPRTHDPASDRQNVWCCPATQEEEAARNISNLAAAPIDVRLATPTSRH